MLAKKKTATNVGVGIGCLLQLVGFVIAGPFLFFFVPFFGDYGHLSSRDRVRVGLALGLVFVGLVFFIWGCISYSLGKGYPGALGLLPFLGLFIPGGAVVAPLVALLVLALLPEKRKGTGEERDG